MTSTAIGRKLPILFNYRDTLFGNGFAVEVHAVNGRAVCSDEPDGVWMYGVNPGGMAARGDDADEARKEFRKAFSEILEDLANEAASFQEFKALVDQFFGDTNPGYETDWVDGVKAVRNDLLHADGMRKSSADAPRYVSVEMKEKKEFRPKDNTAELLPLLAA